MTKMFNTLAGKAQTVQNDAQNIRAVEILNSAPAVINVETVHGRLRLAGRIYRSLIPLYCAIFAL